MERKLLTTVKIGKEFIRVVCLETVSTNLVEIFNDTLWTSNPLEQTKFIKQSIDTINSKIAGEVKEVIAIVESNKKTNLEIKMVDKELKLPSMFVTKQDIKNVIDLAKNDINIVDKKIILAQPVSFYVSDIVKKRYEKAPLNKKGHTLQIRLAISTIDQHVYQYINDIISSADLKLQQILADTQTYAQQTISSNALMNGAISVHVGMKKTSVTINVNATSIALHEFKLGYRDLVRGVSQHFNCTEKNALDLIKVYGSIDGSKEEIIYTSSNGVKIISYTAEHLSVIIKKFLTKIAENSQEFIAKTEYFKKLLITLSGEISSIRGVEIYTKDFFSSEYVGVYKPLTFIATNHSNFETIGAKKLIKRLNNTLGMEQNTVVMTNPNSIEIFKESNEGGKFAKIINNILGGRYARTQ